MKKRSPIQLRIWLSILCLTLLSAACTPAKPVEATPITVEARSQRPINRQVLLRQLAAANVIYLGENHAQSEDHQAQLEIIQALYRRKDRLVIGMEMFQRPFQSFLDQYLSGQITETDLIGRSQYEKRWGYPWEFYAPILRFAQEKQLSIIALNVPSEVTRKVARTGLDSLTVEERQYIPATANIVLGPASYRERLQQIYTGMHQGRSHSQSFDFFFQAQVLWDETMADRIAQAVRQNPKMPIVVLVGQGHLLYGDGIPDRVARRLRSVVPAFTQVSILLNPEAEPTQADQKPLADYFWYTRGAAGSK